MKKLNLPQKYSVYVLLGCLFLVLLFFMPRTGKFNYDYKKGTPWAYETLISEFDFPILKTEEQIQSEMEKAGSSVISYFKYSPEVSSGVINSIQGISLGPYDSLKYIVINSLNNIYSRGVVADESYPSGDDKIVNSRIIFIQKDKRASKHPASDVYSVTSAKDKLRSDLVRGVSKMVSLDSVLISKGVYDLIAPNLLYDKETTELVHAESADYISPTSGFVNAGQLIVSEDEIVTAEIQQMLDSYKVEFEQSMGYSGSRFLLWTGNALIAFCVCLLLFLSVFYTKPDIFQTKSQFLYLIFLVAISSVVALLVEKFNPAILYLTPFTLIALYIVAFFKRGLVLPIYVCCLLPLLVFAHNGIELFVINLVGGAVAIYSYEIFNRGWKQFLAAFIVFVSMFLTYLGFRFINDTHGFLDIYKVVYLFIGAFLSVAGYPLVYLFEKAFGFVSNSRLMELCDTNNSSLLNELSQKAPGTFQHCLQVMNMADAAANSIDANVLLVRAGALYHDIGKMNNPQCFVENEGPGVHYHDGLSYIESAREIVRHVDDGLAIADKYGFPEIIKDFIRTHHGTTCTAYFYNKYINEGGDPDNKSEFCYHGAKPWTKEQIIVMLCDTLEAASRTLKDNSPKTFDDFVENIVSSKMADGQFDDADISIKELTTLKSVLKSYLVRLYHDRIAYPKRKR